MTQSEFVKKFYPFAKEVQEETNIPAVAILAQAALESGNGKYAIGNNIFGIKYKKGDWKHQEVLTTEYSSKPDAFKGQKIKSITYDYKLNKYVYKIWQYFADYPTPKDAFMQHAKLLLSARYKPALKWNYSPVRYLIAVWKLGYATDPEYDEKIRGVVAGVEKRLPKTEDKKYIRELIQNLKTIKSIEAKIYTVPQKVNLEQKLLNRIK